MKFVPSFVRGLFGIDRPVKNAEDETDHGDSLASDTDSEQAAKSNDEDTEVERPAGDTESERAAENDDEDPQDEPKKNDDDAPVERTAEDTDTDTEQAAENDDEVAQEIEGGSIVVDGGNNPHNDEDSSLEEVDQEVQDRLGLEQFDIGAYNDIILRHGLSPRGEHGGGEAYFASNLELTTHEPTNRELMTRMVQMEGHMNDESLAIAVSEINAKADGLMEGLRYSTEGIGYAIDHSEEQLLATMITNNDGVKNDIRQSKVETLTSIDRSKEQLEATMIKNTDAAKNDRRKSKEETLALITQSEQGLMELMNANTDVVKNNVLWSKQETLASITQCQQGLVRLVNENQVDMMKGIKILSSEQKQLHKNWGEYAKKDTDEIKKMITENDQAASLRHKEVTELLRALGNHHHTPSSIQNEEMKEVKKMISDLTEKVGKLSTKRHRDPTEQRALPIQNKKRMIYKQGISNGKEDTDSERNTDTEKETNDTVIVEEPTTADPVHAPTIQETDDDATNNQGTMGPASDDPSTPMAIDPISPAHGNTDHTETDDDASNNQGTMGPPAHQHLTHAITRGVKNDPKAIRKQINVKVNQKKGEVQFRETISVYERPVVPAKNRKKVVKANVGPRLRR